MDTRDRARPRGVARVLRRACRHDRRGRAGHGPRPLARPSGADSRDRPRGRSAAPDHRSPRARDAGQLGLHLGPLAPDRRERRVALPPPPGGLSPDAHRDLRLGCDRHDRLPRLSRRSPASHRPRPDRHGHELLARVSRAAAPVADGSLRRPAQPALRLGPARRPHARALPSAHGRARAGRSDAGRDGARGDHDCEPLRARRGRRWHRRHGGARDRDDSHPCAASGVLRARRACSAAGRRGRRTTADRASRRQRAASAARGRARRCGCDRGRSPPPAREARAPPPEDRRPAARSTGIAGPSRRPGGVSTTSPTSSPPRGRRRCSCWTSRAAIRLLHGRCRRC